jgi:DNA-binding transcriptional ArsR family regulator
MDWVSEAWTDLRHHLKLSSDEADRLWPVYWRDFSQEMVRLVQGGPPGAAPTARRSPDGAVAATHAKGPPRAKRAMGSGKNARKLSLEPGEGEQDLERVAMLLRQVAELSRLKLIQLLAVREMHVSAISEQLGEKPTAVSHHLGRLRLVGIIASRRQGPRTYYGLTETGTALVDLVKGFRGQWISTVGSNG